MLREQENDEHKRQKADEKGYNKIEEMAQSIIQMKKSTPHKGQAPHVISTNSLVIYKGESDNGSGKQIVKSAQKLKILKQLEAEKASHERAD